MTGEQSNQIRMTTRRPPGSIWGYWPFVFPVVLVVVGIAIQIALLSYFKSRLGDFDILANAFDDSRRSTAVMQLGIMRRMKLLSDEDLGKFSEETQARVLGIASL